MNKKYEQQMKKGVLEMLLLKVLEEEEKYGYMLISELREKSGGMIDLKVGTLYPILYRLEDDELVECKWSKAKGKEVSKKYYYITDKGRQAAKELKELWVQFSNQVMNIMEG